jgi:hypothetical protein
MHRATQHSRSIGWHVKILIAVLAVACLIVGLIGLVLPVIPGLVFLFAAILLLSRISPGLARWVKRKPEMNRLRVRFDAMGRLGWGERGRLAFWMVLGGVARGTAVAGSLIARTARSVRLKSSRRRATTG